MNKINRDYCVFTHNKDLELLYKFRNFPVFMGCTDSPPEEDIKADMQWWISKSTGSLQLNPLIPLDVLYSMSHGSGSTGKLWQQHHEEFAEFISKYNVRNALEIGAGHGVLAKNYLNIVSDAHWTIMDPNPAIEPQKNIHIRRGIFDHNYSFDCPIESVIHSHVLEHVYEPMEFMAAISRVLSPGQMHLFSVPRLEVMLERKYTNCINFEHTVFITEPFINYLLETNGFRIEKKQYFLDDHSIFYAAQKMNSNIRKAFIPNQYDKNKKLFNDYVESHHDLIADLHKKIRNHKGKVYMFGAHVFSQYLIGFGLDEREIEFVIDNDSKKQGRRLSGTSLLVRSPKVLKGLNNVAVILRAGVYNNEIKEDIINNINSSVVFWE